MSDHIYIKCRDDMDGYPPYKVYDMDDWLSVMWNDEMHDLKHLVGREQRPMAVGPSIP